MSASVASVVGWWLRFVAGDRGDRAGHAVRHIRTPLPR
ncbi:hypothetical protein FHU38_002943 [Saccharomonospora amisosensis]|uniref:Uncharacterized protein n=1 Tax=Saccharomonospora amisosensis TaxID=1128677 RepID=A0A7X5URT7_9PSEU|nr:hypothetical protein [Saccharomonospora amisosensis]